jgi:hypothetical protein
MSSFKTYSQELPVAVASARAKNEEVQATSSMTSITNLVQRFVTWIDGVDVDGQEYWSR